MHPLNQLSDILTNLFNLTPQLEALLNSQELQLRVAVNQFDPGPGLVEGAREDLKKLLTLIKDGKIEEAYDFLVKANPQNLVIHKYDTMRDNILYAQGRRTLAANRTVFDDIKDLLLQYHALYAPLDANLKSLFIIRDRGPRYNTLRQQIAAAVPDLRNQEMNQLLNEVIQINDPLSIADGQARLDLDNKMVRLGTFVADSIITNNAADPALVQAAYPVYELYTLYNKIKAAAIKLYTEDNIRP